MTEDDLAWLGIDAGEAPSKLAQESPIGDEAARLSTRAGEMLERADGVTRQLLEQTAERWARPETWCFRVKGNVLYPMCSAGFRSPQERDLV